MRKGMLSSFFQRDPQEERKQQGRSMGHERLLDISVQDDITIVSLDTASISAAGVEPIAQSLRDLVARQQPARLVIDFTRVRFISSMMLGLLVDLWRRMKEYGGALCICGIDPQLGRVFRITHLDKIFRFCRDLPEALEALKTRDDRTE
jgi:anti-sigma B factor antagonist